MRKTEGKITQLEAGEIAVKYWKAMPDVCGISQGSTNDFPEDGFRVPMAKRLIKNCWIVLLTNKNMDDLFSTAVVWVDQKMGRVVRSGWYTPSNPLYECLPPTPPFEDMTDKDLSALNGVESIPEPEAPSKQKELW